jgi:hypothetical protein
MNGGGIKGSDERFKRVINLNILDNCWKRAVLMAGRKDYQNLREISLVLSSSELALEAERHEVFSENLHKALIQDYVSFRISTLLDSEMEYVADYKSLPRKDASKQASEDLNLLNFFAQLISVKKKAKEIYYELSSYPVGTSCSIKPIFLNYADLVCFLSPSLEAIEAILACQELDGFTPRRWLRSPPSPISVPDSRRESSSFR